MSLIGVRVIILAAAVLANAGCSTLAYYGQAVAGHLDLVVGSRDIDHLVDNPRLSPALREKLRTVQEIRAFSIDALHLPDNRSYRRYTALQREHVVWNVFAAPPDATRALTWCFPVAGCVGYRGYFAKAAAERFAGQLSADGYDVYVGGVDAYSTLGHFADPVLGSFIDYDEARTAALIFHELAHQVVYVAGDTAFNESFASLVEQVGVERWLAARGTPSLLRRYLARRQFGDALAALMTDYRGRLDAFYAVAAEAGLAAGRARLFDALYDDYLDLGERFGIHRNHAALARSDMNNALVSSFDLYHRLVPAFRRMLARRDGDLAVFYDDVRALAAADSGSRDAALAALMAGTGQQP